MVLLFGLGPSSFVLNASDLQPLHPANLFMKYADDTDLVVPASHSHTIRLELDAIYRWASTNNLKLNVSKSYEMIVKRPRFPADDPSIPPPTAGLTRVSTLKTLGVSFSDRLDFSGYFQMVSSKASRSMYALRVLRTHGLCSEELWQVCRATTVSYLTYASPAWWGYADASSRQRLQSVLAKLKKFGFLPPNSPSHQELCEQMCKSLITSFTSCTTSSPQKKRHFTPYALELTIG